MPAIVKTICAAALLLALNACSKLGMGSDEMTWSREALNRNPHLEIVASDNQARTFTVRLKDSGQLVVIPIDQIVAGPAEAREPAKQAAAAPPADAPAEAPATPASPAPAESRPPAAPATPPPAAPSQSSGSSALASAGQPASSAATSEESAGADEATRQAQGSVPRAQSAANARPGSVL